MLMTPRSMYCSLVPASAGLQPVKLGMSLLVKCLWDWWTACWLGDDGGYLGSFPLGRNIGMMVVLLCLLLCLLLLPLCLLNG